MNIPCQQCKRIITVPDIPLPAGYTQKCTSCGHSNIIESEFEDLSQFSGSPAAASQDDSWDASFDSTMDFLGDSGLENSSNSQVVSGPPASSTPAPRNSGGASDGHVSEEALAAIEERLLKQLRREMVTEQTGPVPMTHRLVRDKSVLVITKNAVLYRTCQMPLEDEGYKVDACSDLEKALKLMQRKPYQTMILDQQFLNTSERGRHIFQWVHETPVAIRRAQVVVLITPGIASAEPQVFFQWGMDLNVHPRDLERMPELLDDVNRYKDALLQDYAT